MLKKEQENIKIPCIKRQEKHGSL
uniref:Uncharacterized protein n=1 Tax=Rhizophora mucronata TaxID=61149 RepID=A0A2P2PKF7_RHIMU